MSVSITGLSRNIQFIISGTTILVPKRLSTIYTSSTQVGVVYYSDKFNSTQEILQFNYASVTSQTFSNSYQAAEYVQSLIDEDQQYINSYIYFSGITASGITPSYISNLSALTISAATIYSGSTDLSSLFITSGQLSSLQTFVQPGTNTYTGGTALNPKVNVSALTINTLNASGNSIFSGTLSGGSSFSANTIFSGTSNLQTIITSLIPSQLFSGTTIGGIKQIYPINNNISSAYNSIIFGFNNTGSSKYSTIVNGLNNKIIDISGNLYHNVILGGKNQTIYNSKYSAVLNGVGNYNGGYYSIISGGYNSIKNAPELVFIFGRNNTVLGNTYSFVFGNNHIISGVSIFSSILGGKSNRIYSSFDASYNLISNSIYSKIAYSNSSIINSGSGNTIQNSSFSNINNGKSNKITSNFSTILNGSYNTGRSDYSTVINGINNSAFGKFSLIGSGVNNKNTTASTYYSVIINGYNNQISTCHAGYGTNITSMFGSVLNGRKNHVFQNYSSIINGNFNHGSGIFSFIGNGYSNKTNFNHESTSANTILNGILNRTKHDFATIINGFFNTIENVYGFVGNGTYNQIPSDGFFGTILNGKQNNVQGGYFNQILNGDYNLISGVNIRHNTIINGFRNKIPNNLSGVTILGGIGLTATTSNTTLGDYAQFRSLTGLTTQMVVADNNGLLSTQSIYSTKWVTGGVYSSVMLNNGYTTANSDYTLVAGKISTINSNSPYSSILGGIGNKIEANSQKSAIVGGMENYIRDYGGYSFIGAGRGNYVLNSKHTVISSGYGNRIYNNSSNSESKYNSIITGYQNKINRGANCTIIGSYNIIGNGSQLIKYSFVSGRQNRIYASYSNILGCYGVVLSDPYTTLVDRLQISTAPLTDNNSLLNINPSNWKVGRTTLSGGSGIEITTANGNLTITYTGSTSSGGGATVNNGINTFTAGTSSFQSVNITALTINTLTASGNSVFSGTFSAITANTTFLKVNTLSGNSTNPERVILYDVQPTSYSNVLVGIGSAQTYAQLNIRNIHNGNQSSSDIVATADNGSESVNYIDMGINSSTFTGYVGFANDGYVYTTGNDLWIGTVTSNKSVKFITDGTGNTSVRMTVSSGGTYINKLSADTIYSGSTLLSTIIFQQTLRMMALGI